MALTLEYLTSQLPKKSKNRRVVTQEVIDEINRLSEDLDYGKEFSESIVTSLSVLSGKDGWSMRQYVDSVKYYSLTAAAISQVDAYARVFPDRLQARLDRGEDKDDMRGEASRFNSSELVNRIREQALVPFYLVNMGMRQEALNIAATIARKGKSEMARVQAVNTILANTTPPETQKIELDIGLGTQDAIADLRKATEALALEQQTSIRAGLAVKSIAESIITDAEVIE